ncbi:hypothetical protein [Pseudoalteromonas marina]|uniref:hypothetical protein n=1 Tax=Pseudoalteromonas marina TaxID=267375 RepID=UPI003C5388DF
MKLKITYPTKERRYLNEGCYQNIQKEVELEPIRIFRVPCGSGAAASRYYYSAEFVAPDDAEFEFRGVVQSNIIRKNNLHFKPKNLNWHVNICDMRERKQ